MYELVFETTFEGPGAVEVGYGKLKYVKSEHIDVPNVPPWLAVIYRTSKGKYVIVLHQDFGNVYNIKVYLADSIVDYEELKREVRSWYEE